jgi:hypothetical protein
MMKKREYPAREDIDHEVAWFNQQLDGVQGILGVGTAETDAAFARSADYPDWEDQLQYSYRA